MDLSLNSDSKPNDSVPMDENLPLPPSEDIDVMSEHGVHEDMEVEDHGDGAGEAMEDVGVEDDDDDGEEERSSGLASSSSDNSDSEADMSDYSYYTSEDEDERLDSHENRDELGNPSSGSGSGSGSGGADQGGESSENPREVGEASRRNGDNNQGKALNPKVFADNVVKFKGIITSLASDDLSVQLMGLTDLCDFLSFCTGESIDIISPNLLSPILVAMVKNEGSPDIMFFAIRAITYLCDALPRASPSILVRHDVVPALVARLFDIEYMDVAEQCFQALLKISRYQPKPCLEAGAIMACLTYLDFFPSSIQRVALSTAANICKKLTSDSSSQFMEAVPVFCNLLQYEDQKLVESAATCLIKIVERMSNSSEMLEELCKNGLISQVTLLLDLNSGTKLNKRIYMGLIGLLSTLASGSATAIKTLFELNISSTLKHILSNNDLSQSMPGNRRGSVVHSNQIIEVLKLLNELLPPVLSNGEGSYWIIMDQPELLRQFGTIILPVLVKVVNTSADLYVCYGCLSVVNKLFYFSRSDMLIDFLKIINISRFLTGVFARKDHHILFFALKIVDTLMKSLPDVLLDSLLKEGVCYAIDSILISEYTPQSMLPSSTLNKELAKKDVDRCLCYAYDIVGSSSSETCDCKLDKYSVLNLAKHIKGTYFPTVGLTETLQKLRKLGEQLSDMLKISISKEIGAELEEKITHILGQIMAELKGGESISTFEFIESGLVKLLLNYLTNGFYAERKADHPVLFNHLPVVLKRFEIFTRVSMFSTGQQWQDMPLAVLVQKLQGALSSTENFPVILNTVPKAKNTHATIPLGRPTRRPCFKVRFVKEEDEKNLYDYFDKEAVTVEPFSTFDAIEKFLWPLVSRSQILSGKSMEQSEDIPHPLPSDARTGEIEHQNTMEEALSESCSSCEVSARPDLTPALDSSGRAQISTTSTVSALASSTEQCMGGNIHNLIFYLNGREISRTLTLYQAILQLKVSSDHDMTVGRSFWKEVYEVSYRKAMKPNQNNQLHDSEVCCRNYPGSNILIVELPFDLENSSPTYDTLVLLKVLDLLNKSTFPLISQERNTAFNEGKSSDLDNVVVEVCRVPQTELVSNKLTEKLEKQMRDTLALATFTIPAWCDQLMSAFPFLFSFEARRKYFIMSRIQSQRRRRRRPRSANNKSNGRRSHSRKFQAHRNQILNSTSKMMERYAHRKGTLEVQFYDEVGTGLGPTMEFYTLVSHEFQKLGMHMWREDHSVPTSGNDAQTENSRLLIAHSGLFPRPWSSNLNTTSELLFCEVIKRFVLLGKVVAKALQDGRVLDLPLSKAFFKLILDQELSIYDIPLIDPGLGRSLLEFQALSDRRKFLKLDDTRFRNTRIEDLYLDFTLPGYPDYRLSSDIEHNMVNMLNLGEYVSLTVDATVNTGVLRQIEAFKSGFNQVFPIKGLQIFNEEELEHLLCGERDAWTSKELLDHINFDHGYKASSLEIVNFLEIIQEFDCVQQRAFVQFVTGAPRLPPGGLEALNPKLTIVRKHCSSKCVDGDLPSVMTCANYLKLPPYSNKEVMRDRLIYAIMEGQGSFHLS
ncbi:hypothetical protein GIB67_030342 [Kingdonia uniflora]|uniref:HECT-type E3 ubiquitin transferase n=1 Tax=Kingdonia uniflora TaxID=39325 RepID=A0A7J7M6L9_9MAGN|nr:hypothetical protein GIB67_030342 [Kingdonia uniflora]